MSHSYTTDSSNVSKSAHKHFHATETALLKVHNDNSLNIDNGKFTSLTLLGLSTAFDETDHDFLTTRLPVHIWHNIEQV